MLVRPGRDTAIILLRRNRRVCTACRSAPDLPGTGDRGLRDSCHRRRRRKLDRDGGRDDTRAQGRNDRRAVQRWRTCRSRHGREPAGKPLAGYFSSPMSSTISTSPTGSCRQRGARVAAGPSTALPSSALRPCRETARIEGAIPWRSFRRVPFPLPLSRPAPAHAVLLRPRAGGHGFEARDIPVSASKTWRRSLFALNWTVSPISGGCWPSALAVTSPLGVST